MACLPVSRLALMNATTPNARALYSMDRANGAELAEFLTSVPASSGIETSPNGGDGEVSKSASIAKRRGGSRNRGDRESVSLTSAQVRNLMASERHARMIGLPFTRMLTIHWEAAGVQLECMAKATGRFTDLMTKVLARHGSSTAWLWVHEGGPGKGGHCHMLVHVPSKLVSLLLRRQMSWLRRITGKSCRTRVIHSKPIGGRLGLERSNPELHAVNLEAALAYVLKGMDSRAAREFDFTRLEPGGRVIGKRCGTSQNIGRKARSCWASDQ